MIGKRPIDLHLSALEKMGAEFTEEDRGLKGKTEGLKGARIVFPKISVGATQNVILHPYLLKVRRYWKIVPANRKCSGCAGF